MIADLSGNSPGVEKPEVGSREFLDIDMDNFEQRMAAIEPGVCFRVANKLGDEPGEKLVACSCVSKDGRLQPGAVARQVPALAKLLEAREQLANLMRYMDGKAAAEKELRKLLNDPALMAALKDAPTTATTKPQPDETSGE